MGDTTAEGVHASAATRDQLEARLASLSDGLGARCTALIQAGALGDGVEKGAALKELAGSMRDAAVGEEISRVNTAKNIAARVLSRGLAQDWCERCWVERPSCYCERLVRWDAAGAAVPGGSGRDGGDLRRIRVWVMQHSGDFWRVNNSGKLLWLCLGSEFAPLCIAEVDEQENLLMEAMEANPSGFCMLWPGKIEGAARMSVEELCASHGAQQAPTVLECVLLDGTWSTAKMMAKRLQRLAALAGIGPIATVHLRSAGVSELDKLRPQPDENKTCTAAAAITLLRELDASLQDANGSHSLGFAADALEASLEVMSQALMRRREVAGLPARRDLLAKTAKRRSARAEARDNADDDSDHG